MTLAAVRRAGGRHRHAAWARRRPKQFLASRAACRILVAHPAGTSPGHPACAGVVVAAPAAHVAATRRLLARQRVPARARRGRRRRHAAGVGVARRSRRCPPTPSACWSTTRCGRSSTRALIDAGAGGGRGAARRGHLRAAGAGDGQARAGRRRGGGHARPGRALAGADAAGLPRARCCWEAHDKARRDGFVGHRRRDARRAAGRGRWRWCRASPAEPQDHDAGGSAHGAALDRARAGDDGTRSGLRLRSASAGGGPAAGAGRRHRARRARARRPLRRRRAHPRGRRGAARGAGARRPRPPFPDTDPRYAGVSSLAAAVGDGAGARPTAARLVNVDATVSARRRGWPPSCPRWPSAWPRRSASRRTASA